MKAGTQAPPSITISKVTTIARPRVISGVRPMAAIKRPKAAVNTPKASTMPTNPTRLPSMRTPKAAMATANTTAWTTTAMTVQLTMRLPSSTAFDSGAARSRFHRPRRRTVSRPMPRSRPISSTNCTLMPAKAWA